MFCRVVFSNIHTFKFVFILYIHHFYINNPTSMHYNSFVR